eukprot:GFUD01012428.1.p1 GENE.GFUD01012428.1~~GFUD01012428.1.p1  ORF type:complete len:336 (+),score=75.58 GFUD01012428.1:29-1009(+)
MELLPDLVEKCGDWTNTLICLGLLYALKTSIGLLLDIHDGWRAFVLPKIVGMFSSDNYSERFGEWAVVTGCTGGIGREYSLGLAKKGMSLVLVSRSRQKLEELEREIGKLYKVKTMIIVADFTKVDVLDQIVGKLKESKLDIGVLVNNVGILGPHFQPFLELDSKLVKDMITVNITAATVLCHELLPAMIQKRKGAIINIASVASYLPGPYLAEYSATKHYMHALTEGIAAEYADTGVIIQEVDPGQVATEMTKDFAPSPGTPPADVYVASALATLGFSQRTMGYWAHGLLGLIINMIPSRMRVSVAKAAGKKNYEHALEKYRKTS